MKILVTEGVFFSRGDETRFFRALESVRAIRNYRGAGGGLELDLDVRKLGREEMIELLAVFRRYGVSRKPLMPFAARKKFAWLREGDWRKILRDVSE